MITIIISDGPEPSEVHVGRVNMREAAMACYEAYEALASGTSDMQVNVTIPDDWAG
jgi:hypothetical protein